MHSKPLAILKTGESFEALIRREGDFEDWTIRALGIPPDHAHVWDARNGELPHSDEVAGMVILGSPHMVTEDEPWMQAAESCVRGFVAAQVPTLGICFGHQLVATALGGTVDWHPSGREMGTVALTLSEVGRTDPLLGGMEPVFAVQSSHLQSVLRLPDGAVPLARSEAQEHEAFRVGATTWGVQFHPEFTPDITRAYVERQRAALEREGRNPDEILAGVTESPAGDVLVRFARMVAGPASRPYPSR
ncbi:MAG: GMP synthase [Gemmatimonadota bacterium]|nr:MAG: GMP synthase [Gemmatimonadota bacterium]